MLALMFLQYLFDPGVLQASYSYNISFRHSAGLELYLINEYQYGTRGKTIFQATCYTAKGRRVLEVGLAGLRCQLHYTPGGIRRLSSQQLTDLEG